MVITNKTEYGHGLKPEFIKRIVIEGSVRTRSGYEYSRHDLGNTGNLFITRKDLVTGEVRKICNIEVK